MTLADLAPLGFGLVAFAMLAFFIVVTRNETRKNKAPKPPPEKVAWWYDQAETPRFRELRGTDADSIFSIDKTADGWVVNICHTTEGAATIRLCFTDDVQPQLAPPANSKIQATDSVAGWSSHTSGSGDHVLNLPRLSYLDRVDVYPNHPQGPCAVVMFMYGWQIQLRVKLF